MSKPEGPVNIDLLAEKKAEQPERGERNTLADYAASASETTRAIDEALSRNMAGGHNNLLNVMPIVNPADPRLRFSADDAVNAAANGYSYYTRLTREVSQLDQEAYDQARREAALQDQARRINRVVNNALINGSNPAPLGQGSNSYSPVFLPPAQYEADGNQLSVTVERRHLPNLPRILMGLGIENRNPTMGLAMGAVEEGGKTFGWPVRVVRQLNNGVVWVESPNTTGRYPVAEVVQNSNPEGWEGYDQRREALHRALRGGQ